MSYPIRELPPEEFPPQLFEIPQPPKQLFLAGALPSPETVLLAVVGSRRCTTYGKDACEKIISGLRGYDIAIVSGLALGIDALAHRTALDAGLQTLAVPGSGLSPHVLYPQSNVRLAEEIVSKGGGLLSEYENDFKATLYSFPQRNRIMAGLCRAVLVIEADEKSGTLITARLATEYNRDVLAVPNGIFSSNSRGTNRLIKQGATPVGTGEDVLVALGFETGNTFGFDSADREKEEKILAELSDAERHIWELLIEPLPRDEIIRTAKFSVQEINSLLMVMEIKGLVKEELGEIRRGM